MLKIFFAQIQWRNYSNCSYNHNYRNLNYLHTQLQDARAHLGVAGLDFFSLLSEPVLVNELVFTDEGVSLLDAVDDGSGDAAS